jgi:para-nitrobenzyl esterase
MKTTRTSLGGALLSVCTALGASAPAQAAAAPVIVATDRGPVSGVATPSGQAFLGIPYAAPPVGALRWRPPEPAPRWVGLRDASQFGSGCPQGPSLVGAASLNEDCLYLNVFTPAGGPRDERGQPYPVMVFIHGGGFKTGTGSDYDPGRLVRRGVVVVTLNYRLGLLGFTAHPTLTAESPDHASGNYGLLDQQAALGWVQHNIAQFGGDPSNVTLFGESAGGLSVHAHLVSAGSAGLFRAAIVQSGAYALTQPPLAVAEAQGLALQAAVGCADLACLRRAPVASLLATEGPDVLQYVPSLDGKVLTQSIGSALATGAFTRVPVIEGTNHDEYRSLIALYHELPYGPITAEQYPLLIAKDFGLPPAVVALITQAYPLSAYPSPSLALAALGTDAMFACPAVAASGWLQRYVPTWRYEFSDAQAPAPQVPLSFPLGAYHAAELQYLFDTVGWLQIPPLSAAQQQLSDAMVGSWVNFARSGDPNAANVPNWAAYQPPLSDRVQQLVAPAPQPGSGSAFAADHRCAFWAALSGL